MDNLVQQRSSEHELYQSFSGPSGLDKIDIAAIRASMVANADMRLSRRAIQRSQKAANTPYTNSEQWEAEYQSLLAAGITDISIGYLRVSDLGQAEAYGLDAQRQGIFAWSHALKGMETKYLSERGIDIWVCDTDFSGRTGERPGIQWCLDKIRSGNIRCLVSHKLDRQARNADFDRQLTDACKKHGCFSKSATESIPDNDLGRLIRTILAAIAEYESTVIAGRLHGGRKEAIRQKGVFFSADAPYGYSMVGNRYQSGKGYMEISPAEARVVVLVYQLRCAGYCESAIADWLNRQGIPTRFGKQWGQGTVGTILDHEVGYRGEGIFSKKVTEYEMIAHQPILPTRPEAARGQLALHSPKMSMVSIPDDPTQPAVPIRRQLSTLDVLDAPVAMTLLMACRLADAGNSEVVVADRLNAAGLTSPKGLAWTASNVRFHLQASRRKALLAAIAAAGVTSVCIPIRPADTAAQAKRDHELAGIARIHGLKAENPKLSMRRLAGKLADEGYRTASGKPWGHPSVQRVLAGSPRSVERVSRRPKTAYSCGLTDAEIETQRIVRAMRTDDPNTYSYRALADWLNEHRPHPRADTGRTYDKNDARKMILGLWRWRDR